MREKVAFARLGSVVDSLNLQEEKARKLREEAIASKASDAKALRSPSVKVLHTLSRVITFCRFVVQLDIAVRYS